MHAMKEPSAICVLTLPPGLHCMPPNNEDINHADDNSDSGKYRPVSSGSGDTSKDQYLVVCRPRDHVVSVISMDRFPVNKTGAQMNWALVSNKRKDIIGKS